MSYIRAFAPWIVFNILPSSSWQWAALIALAISITGIARQTSSGQPLGEQILELGSAAYFAALAALAFADPHSTLNLYTAALASGALSLIAAASLALRKPFTLGIAKQRTPREAWDHPLFIRANMVITAVWTGSFVVGCIVLALLAHSSTTAQSAVQIIAFATPLLFTVRYAATARARREAETALNVPSAV